VRFKPSLVWSLLDSDISQITQSDSGRGSIPYLYDPSQEVEICVATKFAHPLVEEQVQQVSPQPRVDDDVVSQSNTLGGNSDTSAFDMFFQLDPDNFHWLTPTT
jgi:hypothetical protein